MNLEFHAAIKQKSDKKIFLKTETENFCDNKKLS